MGMTRRAMESTGRLWVLSVIILGGCSLLFEEPTIRIVDVRLTGVGLTGATAEIGLEIQNPNGFSVTSTGLDYRLSFEGPTSDESAPEADEAPNWQTIVEGSSREVVTVEGEERSLVTIAVPFGYQDLGRAVLSLLDRGELRYRLTGDVMFDAPIGEVRVAFEDIGDIGL